MIGIGEIEIPPPASLLEQGAHQLLPHPPALILQQAPMAGFRRGRDVVGQIFPLAARFENVQNAIEDFPFVRSWTSSPGSVGQQGLQIVPLCIGDIGTVGLPRRPRNTV